MHLSNKTSEKKFLRLTSTFAIPFGLLMISVAASVILNKGEARTRSQTGVADDGTAIQRAVDSMAAGGTLHLTAGKTYHIMSPIKIGHTNLIIEGNEATLENDTHGKVVIEIDQGNLQPTSSCVIKDVVFTALNSLSGADSSAGAILVTRSFGTCIRNCSFFYLKGGFCVRADQSENLRVESCRFDWNRVESCIEARQSSSDDPYFCNDLSVVNCRIQHCYGLQGIGGIAIVASGANMSIRDCIVNYCAGGGILLGDDALSYGVEVDNVYFEGNSVFDVRCAATHGVRYFQFSNITVRNSIPVDDGMGKISKNVEYSIDLSGAARGEIRNYALTSGHPLKSSLSPAPADRSILVQMAQ